MLKLARMWIDTHCHLEAREFDADRDAVVARARAAGVTMLVMPTGGVDDVDGAAELARRHHFAYAVGIHPLWLPDDGPTAIERLRDAVRAASSDPHCVAVGEIGVDLAEPTAPLDRQEWFYREQLKIARDAGLPVIVHVRRSADVLLKHLRRIEVTGGIIHAFNGSKQQADQLVARGFRLGFGGALTYRGSQRIRRHIATIANEAWVLETDAPYILASWRRDVGATERSEPADVARIAAEVAELRGGIPLTELAAQARLNSTAALPGLARLLEPARERC